MSIQSAALSTLACALGLAGYYFTWQHNVPMIVAAFVFSVLCQIAKDKS
jgi:hypothetical protein